MPYIPVPPNSNKEWTYTMKPMTKIRKFKLNRGRKAKPKIPCFYVVKDRAAGTYVQEHGFGRALTLKNAWKTTERKKARRVKSREQQRVRHWNQYGREQLSLDFVIMPVRGDVKCPAYDCDDGWDLFIRPDGTVNTVCQTCHGSGRIYHEFAA